MPLIFKLPPDDLICIVGDLDLENGANTPIFFEEFNLGLLSI